MSEKSEAQKHRYWVERDSIAIVKKSDSPSENKTYDSPLSVETVNLSVVKLDEDFVESGEGIGITESPEIPEEFHEAIVDYAIMKGYEMSPEGLQSAVYFKQNFKEQVAEGKKYATKNRRPASSTIIPQDF